MERARNGRLAAVFAPLVDRPDLARERYVRGESVPLFRSYADPSVLTDEIVRDPDNVRTDHEIASCQARIAGIE
jgi:hypothetical protein